MLSTDRFIREKECEKLSLEKAGQFPSRRKLGGRSVGWSLSEVLAWKDSCKAVH
ncbi:AlpA family transcriptional regulator [Escherichia coli]|uniref:helix-turn-helix transcriptional regulator n=1 Tax=Escherichia coli TaxID=562 RepID=UPI000DAE5E07|nr:AlpA family phage regulatory protein [Escherichia coli]PZY24384.1 DNA-binding protein [Escherichia coli]